MTLAGGSLIFGIFLIVFLMATIYATYTRTGSGINQRSYRNVHGGAPGAFIDSDLAHDRAAARNLTRGTR
jgi:hypothetical protein